MQPFKANSGESSVTGLPTEPVPNSDLIDTVGMQTGGGPADELETFEHDSLYSENDIHSADEHWAADIRHSHENSGVHQISQDNTNTNKNTMRSRTQNSAAKVATKSKNSLMDPYRTTAGLAMDYTARAARREVQVCVCMYVCMYVYVYVYVCMYVCMCMYWTGAENMRQM